MKKTLLLLVLILSLLCPSLFAQAKAETVRIGMDPGENEIVLNPYVASDSDSVVIMQNLYDGLFSYDGETSEASYALAVGHEVSEDGLTWTFFLREAWFSDGTAITSDTFVMKKRSDPISI